MAVPDDIIALAESRTSAAAHEALLAHWGRGVRDREVLHPLSWNLLMEPEHLTGRTAAMSTDGIIAMFNTAHDARLPNGAR